MNTLIRTYSKQMFDPLNPSPSKVRITDIAHALSNQCRFSGHTKKFYSVAQHSLVVCALLEDNSPLAHLMALLHDAAEAYLVDLPTPLKAHPAFAAFRDYEKQLQGAIESRLIVDEGFSWDELDELRPKIKEADTLALVIEAKRLLDLDISASLPPGEKVDLEKLTPWPPYVAKHQFLDHYFAAISQIK